MIYVAHMIYVVQLVCLVGGAVSFCTLLLALWRGVRR